jgi:hypothetical protein
MFSDPVQTFSPHRFVSVSDQYAPTDMGKDSQVSELVLILMLAFILFIT